MKFHSYYRILSFLSLISIGMPILSNSDLDMLKAIARKSEEDVRVCMAQGSNPNALMPYPDSTRRGTPIHFAVENVIRQINNQNKTFTGRLSFAWSGFKQLAFGAGLTILGGISALAGYDAWNRRKDLQKQVADLGASMRKTLHGRQGDKDEEIAESKAEKRERRAARKARKEAKASKALGDDKEVPVAPVEPDIPGDLPAPVAPEAPADMPAPAAPVVEGGADLPQPLEVAGEPAPAAREGWGAYLWRHTPGSAKVDEAKSKIDTTVNNANRTMEKVSAAVDTANAGIGEICDAVRDLRSGNLAEQNGAALKRVLKPELDEAKATLNVKLEEIKMEAKDEIRGIKDQVAREAQDPEGIYIQGTKAARNINNVTDTVNSVVIGSLVLGGVIAAFFGIKKSLQGSYKVLRSPLSYFGRRKRIVAYKEILRQLILHPRADLMVRNSEGKTALELVQEAMAKSFKSPDNYNSLKEVEMWLKRRQEQLQASR